MKREIKFRAWDSVNNKMEYNVNVNDGKPVKKGYQWFLADNTVHKSDLEQYTGLKDKNGVEIYENDIVKLKAPKRYELLEVVFIDGAFCIGRNNIGQKYNNGDDFVTIRDAMFSAKKNGFKFNIEVIGNIHEIKNY